MDRYDIAKTTKVKDRRGRLIDGFDKRTPIPERTILAGTKYPFIERNESDVFIETRIGDRFDMIAHEFYGDVTLWWIIAMANDIPGDSMYPPMGFQLRIPNNSADALNAYEKANTNL